MVDKIMNPVPKFIEKCPHCGGKEFVVNELGKEMKKEGLLPQ